MENQFDDVMRKRTDADLIKIINGPPDDYQPNALEAAKREYERRDLSDEQVTIVNQEITREKAIDDAKANTPLDTTPKILAFMFPGIILFMFAGTFRADGYDRKARELIRWTLYGFGFYVGFVVLIMVLSELF